MTINSYYGGFSNLVNKKFQTLSPCENYMGISGHFDFILILDLRTFQYIQYKNNLELRGTNHLLIRQNFKTIMMITIFMEYLWMEIFPLQDWIYKFLLKIN